MSRKAKGWGRAAFNYRSHYRMFQRGSPGGGENWLHLIVLRELMPRALIAPAQLLVETCTPPCSTSPQTPWENSVISMSMFHVDVKELATISTTVTKSCLKIKIKFFQSQIKRLFYLFYTYINIHIIYILCIWFLSLSDLNPSLLAQNFNQDIKQKGIQSST